MPWVPWAPHTAAAAAAAEPGAVPSAGQPANAPLLPNDPDSTQGTDCYYFLTRPRSAQRSGPMGEAVHRVRVDVRREEGVGWVGAYQGDETEPCRRYRYRYHRAVCPVAGVRDASAREGGCIRVLGAWSPRAGRASGIGIRSGARGCRL